MNITVFEDRAVQRLDPITLGRPAYCVTCGAFRLIDWLLLLGEPLCGLVRPHLAEIQRLDYPELSGPPQAAGHPLLLVNARLVPSAESYETLQAIAREGRPGVVRDGGDVAAALVNCQADAQPAAPEANALEEYFAAIGLPQLETLDRRLPLLHYPHDVIRYNLETLARNLEYRVASGAYCQTADGVFLADGATIGQSVVIDSSQGPVVIEKDASIGHFCLLRGPAFIGQGAKLIEHAAIKDAVSVGHTTKIGGEVEASVVEPYTNKQHHGFLGHSYLGSWINLGAGTCNSDLKNTYGKVNMEYRGEKVATDMQFVGCVMGDYSKTAINTGIFTGKVIGVCSMLYGFVTTNVPSFVNYARLFGQVTELPPDVMIATQQRMFQRRKVSQRPCDRRLIQDMFELTREERRLVGEPLTL